MTYMFSMTHTPVPATDSLFLLLPRLFFHDTLYLLPTLHPMVKCVLLLYLSPVAFCFGRWVSYTTALILFLAKACSLGPAGWSHNRLKKAKHMGVHWIFSASFPRDKINSVDILTGPKWCHLENCLNKTCLSRFKFSSHSKNNWFIFIEFLSSQRTPYAFQEDISIQATAERNLCLTAILVYSMRQEKRLPEIQPFSLKIIPFRSQKLWKSAWFWCMKLGQLYDI